MFPDTPAIEHICFGPGSQMWIQVKRTQASFCWWCSCSLENGGIHFSCPPWQYCGKKVFCLTVVSMCVLFRKRKISRSKWRESGCSGSDYCPSHPSGSAMNLALRALDDHAASSGSYQLKGITRRLLLIFQLNYVLLLIALILYFPDF